MVLIEDREVLSGREFLELCRHAAQDGRWIPRVELVGPSDYRIASVRRRAATRSRKTERHNADQFEFPFTVGQVAPF